jgi:hypothetical protein
LIEGLVKEGVKNPVIRINRYDGLDSKLSLQYSLGGTAVSGVDYDPVGDIVFNVGQEYIDVDINVVNDSVVENDRTLVFTLGDNEGFTISGQTSVTAVIKDDDTQVVSVAPGTQIASEQLYLYDTDSGDILSVPVPLTFVFTRSGNIDYELSVTYHLSGTATFGETSETTDYTLTDYLNDTSDVTDNTFTVTFAAGMPTAVIYLHPYDDNADLTTELTETVIATVLPDTKTNTYAVSDAASTATDYILDTDIPQISISATGNTLTETGPGSITITATRIGDINPAVTLSFLLTGEAQNGVDFTMPVTVTIPAGQNSTTFALTAIDDVVAEPTESFNLTLLSDAHYSSDPYAHSLQFKIVDNDPVSVSVQADGDVTESGTQGKFILTRTGSLDQTMAVSYTMSGTAASGVDYLAPGTLVFQKGQSTLEVSIKAQDDILPESSETVVFTLNATANYNPVDPGNATLSITDNDDETNSPSAVSFKVSGVNKSASSSTITIAYHDDTKIRAASIARGNIEILGPNGYSQIASLASISTSANSADITAVYRFIPTGLAWSKDNVGSYVVYIRANQVKDIYGTAMSRTKIGQFVVKKVKSKTGFSVKTTSYATSLEAALSLKRSTKDLLFSDTPIL